MTLIVVLGYSCRLVWASRWGSFRPPVLPTKQPINLAEDEVEEVGEGVDDRDEEEGQQARDANHIASR